MVYVNDTERSAITAGAHAAGMSVSAYLRARGTYQVPRHLPNRKALDGLADLNADVGRLMRTLAGRVEPDVIQQIETVQAKLSQVAEEIGR